MSTSPEQTPFRPPGLSSAERFWASFAHLGTLLGYVVGLGHFIPPLVVYFAKRDDSEFVGDQAKESLNFQINVILAYILAVVLCFTGVGVCLGVPMLVLTAIGQLVFVLVAGIKARDGELYRYPIGLRLF